MKDAYNEWFDKLTNGDAVESDYEVEVAFAPSCWIESSEEIKEGLKTLNETLNQSGEFGE